MFKCMMDGYGTLQPEQHNEPRKKRSNSEDTISTTDLDMKICKNANDATLMQAEERKTGSVPWKLYLKYLRSAGGIMLGPFIAALLMLTQAAEGMF
jgi:ATP-binding cassette subfamily C (CFTR/MRP) protein 1